VPTEGGSTGAEGSGPWDGPPTSAAVSAGVCGATSSSEEISEMYTIAAGNDVRLIEAGGPGGGGVELIVLDTPLPA